MPCCTVLPCGVLCAVLCCGVLYCGVMHYDVVWYGASLHCVPTPQQWFTMRFGLLSRKSMKLYSFGFDLHSLPLTTRARTFPSTPAAFHT